MGCVTKSGRWMLTLFASLSAREERGMDGKAETLQRTVYEAAIGSD